MGRAPTLSRAPSSPDPKSREFDRMLKTLSATPQILCWRCRKLTSFEIDQCEHCGSPFAGNTGGAHRSGRVQRDESVPAPMKTRRGSRSLAEIVEDLRRIRDLTQSSEEPAQREQGFLYLYQCPSCARFVSQRATACVCGVRFTATFECPECASSVPSGRNACPVCRVNFGAAGVSAGALYMCPRCGANVTADAFRCSCGARFLD
jgi:RNA polymerase subunit RPABC4/transcription elongation factor Spt4